MQFHFSCTRNPHTEREVYTMRTPRLRLLSAILAVVLFFTLLPVSALAEDGGSNANTGLTIGIVGNLNQWVVSHSISMKEVSPAVYEVTVENKSYGDINGSIGFIFVKDNSWDNSWGFGTVSSGELHDAVYRGSYIKIDPGSDAEESKHNFIIRLDLTNWDWGTKTGATFTVTVAAATSKFDFDKTTGTITKYNGTDTVVVIPSKINGVTVETIGHAAFEKSAVTSVTIPDSVTAILDRAFANCSQLTNISIPNSVTSIGFSAFEGCTKLESITLPSSLRNISMFLFHNCSQLTTIQIPDSVPSIQDYAFGNCTSLETIHIPVSVTSIGNRAFAGCPSSMTVTYSGSKKQWDSITGKDELLNIPLVCNKLEATFNPDNGEPTVTKFIDNDKNSKFAELVPEPTKENYTFAGWYNGNEKFDFTTVPTGDVTLTAKWTANDYYVSFVTEHGAPPTSQNVKYNGTADDPGKLSAEGYTFIGWYTDDTYSTEFDFTKPIKRNTTVYAKWTANDYEVSFITEHGDPPASQNVKYNGTADDPGKLTAEGYTFIGWYADAAHTKEFDFTKPITSNTTVYAKWTAKDYEVSFITEYGDAPTSQNVKYNGTADDPGKLSAEGYTFIGWYTDDTYSTEFDFTKPIKRNTTVYAKWTANDYEVSFITEHGDPPASQNVKYNGTADDPGKLTAEGYTFIGWYADAAHTKEFDFTKPITSNTTVYAKWTAKDYEVSFITEYGDAPTSQNVKYNGTATDPGKLTADGYTFDDWYTDDTYSTKFDFTQPIKRNTKVYAKWEKNAPVLPDTYALNVSGAFVYVDGVDVTASAGDTSLQLKKDASVRLVADPDRMPSGMVFDRWTILNGALNADDAEKFETGRTLEEFAFTMPAEPLSIEATPRMQEEEGSDTASVILGVTLGTAATALVAWQAYDLGMSLYQEHWLPADFVMPKTRAELALLLWNTAGRPAPATQPAFADIPDPDTAQAAQWAVETGLMTPKSADLFKPEKSVTRWKAIRSWKRVTNQNP